MHRAGSHEFQVPTALAGLDTYQHKGLGFFRGSALSGTHGPLTM